MQGQAVQSASEYTEQVTDKVTVGLKVALNILERWQCKPNHKQAILGMARSTLYKAQDNPASARLSPDQLERVSYILNIHQALRIVFCNPENVYGFKQMTNHNPYFNGKTPLDLIATGNFGTLYEVFKRIDTMRGSQW
jgi:uncharacterized protein (DUF2384 family)